MPDCNDTSQRKSPVGVSGCLLGMPVRFNGGHQKDRFVAETLAEDFDWVSVCPEVGIGLGTPRETIRLERQESGLRLISKSGEDHTTAMNEYSERQAEKLASRGIRGFVLKKASPTCGMERVRVYSDRSPRPNNDGVGLFAAALKHRLPHLPMEDEGRLNDRKLRENFITRVFAYDRWLCLREQCQPLRRADLIRFHTGHKMLLLAHAPSSYRHLGRMLADFSHRSIEETADLYEEQFMQALSKPASAGRHANVLQHLLGFLRDSLPAPDRRELSRMIEEFRRGWLPLSTPVALLRHHLQKLQHPWVDEQVYLEPHPRHLGLWSQPLDARR